MHVNLDRGRGTEEFVNVLHCCRIREATHMNDHNALSTHNACSGGHHCSLKGVSTAAEVSTAIGAISSLLGLLSVEAHLCVSIESPKATAPISDVIAAETDPGIAATIVPEATRL